MTPTWTEVTAGNWGDRWDIAYGSGSINADRMQRLYMTQPYYAVPNMFFVAKDSAYRKPADLNGKEIGACADCSQELYLKRRARDPGRRRRASTSRTRRSSPSRPRSQGSTAAAKGKIDAFLAADPVGRRARSKRASR